MSRVENKKAHCDRENQAGSCSRTVKASRAKYPTEDEEQMDLAEYLNDRFGYYGWIHVPNQRMAKVQYLRKLAKMGVKKGFPDIIIFERVLQFIGSENTHVQWLHGMMIELKRKKGSKVTEEQALWRVQMIRTRWASVIAYGAEDAIKKIEEVYGVKK